MDKIIANFSQQIREAIQIGSVAKINPAKHEINNVVVCGLGGSGIGGKIISQLVKDELKVPFSFVNDYVIPGFINENSLVIASSYSGNTEETISTVKQAMTRGAEIALITSGGELLEMAKEKGWNYIVVPGGEQPRAMLAYSLIQQLYLLKGYGLISDKHLNDLNEAIELVESLEEKIKQEAKEVANNIIGFTPIIYADAEFEGLATRVRQQINENGKELCWHHVLPEMTHNELVGWAGGNNKLAPIYLATDFDHVRTKYRWDICKEVIGKYTSNIQEIKAKGKSKIAQLFYLIHFTDWLSYYIAEIKKIDPVEVDVITYLKTEMAKK